MNYQQACFYIEECQQGRERFGLNKLEEVLHQLHDPHKKLSFVHVAGTNGKGSTAAMLSSVLTKAGYKTGLYTSPHLMRYNERMKINGQDIPDEDFIEAAETVKKVCDKMGGVPIVFEILTLMALWYFAKEQCDIVILEVGIGGRIDATNCIPSPKAAVITQLGLDHTETLGDTLEKIAAEKGGIIKPGCYAVMAEQQQSAMDVVREICKQKQVPLTIASVSRMKVLSFSVEGQQIEDKEYGAIFLPLAGSHQVKNLANVLETVGVLKQQGYQISNDAVVDGIRQTKWPARMQRLCTNPDFLLDGGHNPQCVQAVTEALKAFYPDKKVVFLTGMMQDKDTDRMLEEMVPLAQEFVCIHPDSQRAMDQNDMCRMLRERYGVQATACQTVNEGIRTAIKKAGDHAVVCALGSLYLAGEIQSFFEKGEQCR